MTALVLAHLTLVLHSAGSSDGGTGSILLLLAGPACGTALYAAIHRYYRNADKTDAFERETRIVLKDRISGDELKVDEVRGTRKHRVEGDNSGDHRVRVAELE